MHTNLNKQGKYLFIQAFTLYGQAALDPCHGRRAEVPSWILVESMVLYMTLIGLGLP